ncbi:MAG: UbiX family flavin prenyltransferase [Roseburia sp.]
MSKKIILGISGASGVILGFEIAKALKRENVELHMVITDAARLTWECECKEIPIEKLIELSDECYEVKDMAALIASGSFRTDGMIVAPCSMKTLAGIVSGYTDNLLLRAADVCLKEGRKVVLCPREMPLGRIHLRNLSDAAEYGCTIVPPMMSFYSGQMTMQDQLNHIVGKVLMQFDIEFGEFRPWTRK